MQAQFVRFVHNFHPFCPILVFSSGNGRLAQGAHFCVKRFLKFKNYHSENEERKIGKFRKINKTVKRIPSSDSPSSADFKYIICFAIFPFPSPKWPHQLQGKTSVPLLRRFFYLHRLNSLLFVLYTFIIQVCKASRLHIRDTHASSIITFSLAI